MIASLRVIFLSYERGLTDPSSESFGRVEGLGAADVRLSAVVLPATVDTVVAQGNLRVIGLTGSVLLRLWRVIRAASNEVRCARKQGERVLLSAQDPFVTGGVALLLSRLYDVPYEVQEHGDFFSGAWVREVPVIHRVWIWIGRAVLRRAEGVRVVSDRIRSAVLRIGVDAHRVAVIPVAQDVVALAERLPRAWPATPTIVVPCRFVKQKGLRTLGQALALVAQSGVAFRVRVIGEGPEGPRLASDVARMGIRDRFSFEQWSDSMAIWDDADLFVLSSDYEGWGRTIVEAMAAGVPVVTTDVGCVGSFFRPHVDGVMVPSGNAPALASAIRAQCIDSVSRTQMAAHARSRIAELASPDVLRTAQRVAWQRLVNVSVSRTVWKWTFGIVAMVAVIRLVSFVWFGDTLGTSREWGFFHLIQSWFEGHGYAYTPGQLSAYRSPGYLFFLTVVYGVFGFANFVAQAVIQNILAVVLVYLVYRLGWRVADDRRVGWVAAVLVAVHPYTFYHYTQYYHTVFSGLFLVSLLLSLLALERSRRLRWAAWAGVMTAALAYVQGTILVAMPFLAMWLLWRWRKDLVSGVFVVGVIAIVSAGLIAPWTIRNWVAFHTFVPLTTDLGLALYKANTENYERLLMAGYPHEALKEEVHPSDPSLVRYHYLPEVRQMLEVTGGVFDAAFWTQWHPAESSAQTRVSEPEVNAHWMALAREWMVAHPGDFVRLALRKAVVFWQPALYPSVKYGAAWSFGNESALAFIARWALIAYVAMLEILALGGFIVMMRRKRLAFVAPLLIVMAAYTAMHMLFAPYTKYRIPLDQLVAILAAMMCILLYEIYLSRSSK